ncbi:MAG TPA: hypothetical protein VG963_15225, partial [Polyangiaceae bacterium]|nr:hypothetical protein [Polyangiaceae bacterium]
ANMGAGVAIDGLAAARGATGANAGDGAALVLGAVGGTTVLLALALTARGFAPHGQAQLGLSVRE